MAIAVTASQGRPSYLENEVVFEAFCAAEASGMTREQAIDKILDDTDGAVEIKSLKTISVWRKDPRVKRRVFELTRDRAVKAARAIDAEIERRLGNAEEINLDLLIKLRKEFVGENLRQSYDEVDERTVGEMNDWAAENPELAKMLMDSFVKEADVA
jgi:hypothetical protein